MNAIQNLTGQLCYGFIAVVVALFVAFPLSSAQADETGKTVGKTIRTSWKKSARTRASAGKIGRRTGRRL